MRERRYPEEGRDIVINVEKLKRLTERESRRITKRARENGGRDRRETEDRERERENKSESDDGSTSHVSCIAQKPCARLVFV